MPVSHANAAAILKKSSIRRFSDDTYVFGSGYVKLLSLSDRDICEIGVSHYKLRIINIKDVADDNAFIELIINQVKLYDLQTAILVSHIPESCSSVKSVEPTYGLFIKSLAHNGKERSPLMVVVGTGLPSYDTPDKMLHMCIIDESIIIMQQPSTKSNYSLIYTEELSNPKCKQNVQLVVETYLNKLYELQTFDGHKLFKLEDRLT